MADEKKDAADQPNDGRSGSALAGGTRRLWHLHSWCGMNAAGWFRLLAANRFAVSPTRIPMAMILTGLSVINSSLSLLQRILYGRRIAGTELVEDPVLVLGHWRSGTTLLHELLVCDPRHTFPDTYACFGPNHFVLTERFLKRMIAFLLPPQRPMDNMEIRWEYPQEDEWALCNMGLPSPYAQIMFPNQPQSGAAYLDFAGVSETDRQRWKDGLRWFLQCLTVREAKRIVLKTPPHTARIAVLLEAFPDARFVHIVRNPYHIFSSTMHTWRRMYSELGVQVPRFKGLEEHVLSTFCCMYEAFERDVPKIPAGHFCEVYYEDLIRDPVTQMKSIYERIGLGDFEPARPGIEAYAQRTAGYRPNRHELSESTRQRVAERWGAYLTKYGYDRVVAERT